MSDITRTLRDAFVQLDAGTHSAIPVAEAIAFLARFYHDTMRSVNPDAFYGLGPEQQALNDLHSLVLAFEALVRGHRELFVEDTETFIEWAREIPET